MFNNPTGTNSEKLSRMWTESNTSTTCFYVGLKPYLTHCCCFIFFTTSLQCETTCIYSHTCIWNCSLFSQALSICSISENIRCWSPTMTKNIFLCVEERNQQVKKSFYRWKICVANLLGEGEKNLYKKSISHSAIHQRDPAGQGVALRAAFQWVDKLATLSAASLSIACRDNSSSSQILPRSGQT